MICASGICEMDRPCTSRRWPSGATRNPGWRACIRSHHGRANAALKYSWVPSRHSPTMARWECTRNPFCWAGVRKTASRGVWVRAQTWAARQAGSVPGSGRRKFQAQLTGTKSMVRQATRDTNKARPIRSAGCQSSRRLTKANRVVTTNTTGNSPSHGGTARHATLSTAPTRSRPRARAQPAAM